MAVLESLGFEPRRQGGTVILDNCPFHRLARLEPELVCGLNLCFIQGLLRGCGGDEGAARLRPQPSRCCVVLEEASS